MAAWSGLFRSVGKLPTITKNLIINQSFGNGKRLMSGHREFPMVPSRWHWTKYKDLMHLYFFIGAIPITITVFCVNIFIGPATLEPIPEGYVPKHWEYFRHPISRFIARYLHTPEQQEYEKMLHFLWAENEVRKIRALEKQVKELMAKRKDYQAYYYEPYNDGKYIRQSAQAEKDSMDLYGSVSVD